ncbi:Por secretion system C-terminal sorting domain-containing protein [Spirosomataceae bacterium TFI 002]|nr:Por secretion system C-terminal sorting domain-containing protein [Spirosomataceae bacterium TFI 002]
MKKIHTILSLLLLAVLETLATTPISSVTQVGTSNSVMVAWGETDVTISPGVSLNRFQISYNVVGMPATVIDNISASSRSFTINNLNFGSAYEIRVVEVIRVTIPPTPFTPPFIDSFNSSSNFNITLINPNRPPTAKCKDINKELGNSETVMVAVEDANNGSFDPDNNPLNLTLDNYGPFSVGEYYVQLTVTESNTVQMLSSSCYSRLTVADRTGPIVRTRTADVFLNSDGYGELDPRDLDYGTSDNTGYYNLSLDRTLFSCNDVGDQQVILTAMDTYGNKSSKAVSIRVFDKIEPYIIDEPVTFFANAQGQVVLTQELLAPLAFDPCGIKQITANQEILTTEMSSGILEIIAIDNHGNVSAKALMVNIVDNLPPNISGSVSIYLDEKGEGKFSSSMIENLVNDPSGISSITVLDNQSFNCNSAKDQSTNVYASDNAGNTQIGQVTITVLDTIKPTITLDSIVLTLNSSGKAEIILDSLGSLGYDNCSIVSSEFSQTEFMLADTILKNIQLTLTDPSGNSTTKNIRLHLNRFKADAGRKKSVTDSGIFSYGPNPVKNSILINMLNSPTSNTNTIRVRNSLGQLIKTIVPKTNSENVDLSAYPIGTYYLEVENQSGIQTERILFIK